MYTDGVKRICTVSNLKHTIHIHVSNQLEREECFMNMFRYLWNRFRLKKMFYFS